MWSRLREQYRFSAAELATLQPDKQEWVKRGALTLHDMMDMTVFPVKPITDMQADLAEVWSMHWTPEQLHSLSVTYANVLRKCLTQMYYILSLARPLLSPTAHAGVAHCEWQDSRI